MFTRATIAILCLGWFVVPGDADEPPKYKPIDAETIAAYEKLGATHGRFEFKAFAPYEFGEFWMGREKDAIDLPGFRLVPLPDGTLPKLPPVQVPFGLYFRYAKLTDAGLKEIKDLNNLTTLNLSGTPVNAAGLKHLKDLKNLTTLDLIQTKLTDAGLKELKDLQSLTRLNLAGTNVTDEGLKVVSDFKNLTRLNLSGTKVTDEGLKDLKRLKNLATLFLVQTKVTDACVKDLEDALPKIEIIR